MDMVFMGDTHHRAKFNLVIADAIEPFLFCQDYMDREDNENELKQVCVYVGVCVCVCCGCHKRTAVSHIYQAE